MTIIATAVNNKHLPFSQWSDLIDRFVDENKIGPNAEIRAMESLARKVGINPKPYDNKPYGEFLEAIHSKLNTQP